MQRDSLPMKACSKCGEVKRFDDFNKSMASRDGLKPHCKTCTKTYYAENQQQILQQKANKRQQHPPGVKCCSHCQFEKPYSDFHKDKTRSDGYRHYCKACGKAHRDGRDVTPARREPKPRIIRLQNDYAALLELRARVEKRRAAVARLVKAAGYVIDNAEIVNEEMIVALEDFNDLREALVEMEELLSVRK